MNKKKTSYPETKKLDNFYTNMIWVGCLAIAFAWYYDKF